MVRNHLIHKINCRHSNRSVTCSFNPWLLILVETTDIRVQSGNTIVLHSNLTEMDLQLIKDVRWTHLYLVVSLKSNVTVCPHGRCELLTDGSLSFNCVYAEDAGSYRLQAFDKHGNRVMTKDFLLQVDTGGTAHQADIIATATATGLPNHKSSTSDDRVNTSVLKAGTESSTNCLSDCLSVSVSLLVPPPFFLSVASSSVLVHTVTWVFLIFLFLSLIIFVIVRRRHRSMSAGMTVNQKQPDLCHKNQLTVYKVIIF